MNTKQTLISLVLSPRDHVSRHQSLSQQAYAIKLQFSSNLMSLTMYLMTRMGGFYVTSDNIKVINKWLV